MEATIRRRPDSARPQADVATVEAGILALQTSTRCSGYSAAMTWA